MSPDWRGSTHTPAAAGVAELVLRAEPVIARFAGASHTADELRAILRARLADVDPARISAYAARGRLDTWLRVVAVRVCVELLRHGPG